MTTRPKTIRGPLLAAGAAAMLMLAALLAPPAQAALRHYDGTVVSTTMSPKTLTIRTQTKGKVTFLVDARTEFERLGGGFGSLARGQKVEVDAVMNAKGLIARQIEPGGGGGGGGGRGGNDDPPGHD